MAVHLFGIRHHGPGSARSLQKELQTLSPDIILIEGPPEANHLIPLVPHKQMRPPVALLLYEPGMPRHAAFYPFTIFSPEWRALLFAVEQKIEVRFFDLPQTYQLATARSEHTRLDGGNTDSDTVLPPIRHDPMTWLATAAGYSDGEEWWERMVEQRSNAEGIFDGIVEAMTALREGLDGLGTPPATQLEARREAWMRNAIRSAQKDGFTRIAVVCGALHTPALQTMPPAKHDQSLLKGMPKVKVVATWVPWSYSRLDRSSGYGAGVTAPGWYHHIWQHGADASIHWMGLTARMLRSEGLDVSPSHVIEAVRLATALAAMRDRPQPGRTELEEATQSVFCFGDESPLALIQRKLVIGDRLGQVPDDTPMVPLQAELLREQRRLRLKQQSDTTSIDLDLRSQYDLDRSHLLHRLSLLGIDWGKQTEVRGKKGTFHEVWDLTWRPELSILLVEASHWGSTILDAATLYAHHLAERAISDLGISHLPTLTSLVDRALLADLPDAVGHLMQLLESETAISSDVSQLIDALPPLASVMRYGNVRRTDTAMVARVVDGLVVRICIGIPPACASLDEDAAHGMVDRLVVVERVIGILHNEEHTTNWLRTLGAIANIDGTHGLVAGRACRLLLDAGRLVQGEAERRMSLALSLSTPTGYAAAWIEGFLANSGLLLLHDEALWRVLDSWVSSLRSDAFVALLPLLRRTFSTFAVAERRQIGERVRSGGLKRDGVEFDNIRAERSLGILSLLLEGKDVMRLP